MTVEPLRAAGWYDDETDAASLRYWDGRRWTPHTASKPHEPRATTDLFALFAVAARVEQPPMIDHTSAVEHTAVIEHTAVLEQTTEPLAPEPAAPGKPRRRRLVGGGR